MCEKLRKFVARVDFTYTVPREGSVKVLALRGHVVVEGEDSRRRTRRFSRRVSRVKQV